jgi:hypothetical protein
MRTKDSEMPSRRTRDGEVTSCLMRYAKSVQLEDGFGQGENQKSRP